MPRLLTRLLHPFASIALLLPSPAGNPKLTAGGNTVGTPTRCPHKPSKIPPRPSYIRDTTARLSGRVSDLEDVMAVMAVLDEVRERESNIDGLIMPIEDMYALLTRYEVGQLLRVRAGLVGG
jgi:hypothetical protein